jgi:hypothetical protein
VPPEDLGRCSSRARGACRLPCKRPVRSSLTSALTCRAPRRPLPPRPCLAAQLRHRRRRRRRGHARVPEDLLPGCERRGVWDGTRPGTAGQALPRPAPSPAALRPYPCCSPSPTGASAAVLPPCPCLHHMHARPHCPAASTLITLAAPPRRPGPHPLSASPRAAMPPCTLPRCTTQSTTPTATPFASTTTP